MATNSQINKAREKSSLESQEKRFSRKSETSKEVQQAAIGKEAYREAVELGESVETTGKVSEVAKAGSEQKGGGAVVTAKATTAIDPDKIKARLLRDIPSEKIMKKQIEREIKKEIEYLHKKAIKLMAVPSGMSFFEMTNLMRKIRELKSLLVALVKASLDSVKTFWLRFVHGVM